LSIFSNLQNSPGQLLEDYYVQRPTEPLVDLDGGRVNRRVYSDRAIYDQELRDIFGKKWLLLGHESQIRSNGSYFTTYMGEDPIIVSRDGAGRIHAHLNACAHRGARVCLDDGGVAKMFLCPYHAWSFGLDGRLIGVPHNDRFYGKRLDKSELNLRAVAKLETLYGLIFATFDPDAVPLREHLGAIVPFLGAVFDRSEGGVEIVGSPQKWRVPTNWKIYQDNFAGDEYHVASTHGSSIEAIGLDWDTYLGGLIHCAIDGGHGLSAHFEQPNGRKDPYTPMEQPTLLSQNTQDYLYGTLAEVDRRCSRIHARCQWAAGAVFPNFSLLPVFNTFRIVHPKGPGEIELWSYCYVDRDAPADVKRELVKFYNLSFGPAGIIEQDDSAVWESIATSARGVQGRKGWSDYTMGLGDEHWHEGLGCMITDRLSEAAQRSFYRSWAKAMGVHP
jgi:3-phenylpropionate/trans-cinnamate dioxygenase alpha subunit